MIFNDCYLIHIIFDLEGLFCPNVCYFIPMFCLIHALLIRLECFDIIELVTSTKQLSERSLKAEDSYIGLLDLLAACFQGNLLQFADFLPLAGGVKTGHYRLSPEISNNICYWNVQLLVSRQTIHETT